MTVFQYRARDQNGELITGEIEAESANELKEALFHEGMIPLSVQDMSEGVFSFERLKLFFERVKHEELMVFTRQFHTLFKAGISTDTIFSTLVKQVNSVPLVNALVRIRADIASGSALAPAFARHPKVFNELYISMLAAGEEGGILEEVLKNLSELLERDHEITRNIKSAMLYPKIVITVMFLAILFLMTFVVPRFVTFYSQYSAELPLPTQILIFGSNLFRNYWYVGVGLLGLIFYGFQRVKATHTGSLKIDRLRFRLPVFGQLHLKAANARFARIVAALYRTGLSMTRALEVAAKVIGNAAFGLEVLKVRDDIQKGASLSKSMSQYPSFSPLLIETMAVGEQSGAIDEMLAAIADHYEMEVNHMIRNLTALLEPLLLGGIFGIVALLALAIFLPIWDISSAVKGGR